MFPHIGHKFSPRNGHGPGCLGVPAAMLVEADTAATDGRASRLCT